jgi:hypothetical protein
MQYVGQWDIITTNVPLILKVRDMIFFLQAKTPRNAPLYVLPQTKKNISRAFQPEVHWYFYVPKRERARARAKGRARARAGKGKRKEQRKGKGKRKS